MKILHVLNELRPSGAETMLQCSHRSWRQHGIDPEILATGRVRGDFSSSLEEAGYRVHHLPFRKSLSFFVDFAKLLTRSGARGVHVHSERAAFYYLAVARACRLPAVRTIHAHFEFSGTLGVRRSIQRAMVRAMGCAQVSVSPSVQQTEIKYLRNPTTVISNWYDDSKFVPPTVAERQRARAELELGPEKFVVACVGNCAPVKNHGELLRAVSLLRDGPDCVLLHAGEEEPGAVERALAHRLGLSAKVIFLGRVTPLRVLHASDAFVLPSLREGFGISAAEALGAGLPAVVSNGAGLIQATDVAGVRRVPARAESIAQALREVAALSADDRARLGWLAHETARAAFGIGPGVEAYSRLYRATVV